jgi:hypothetical protein
MDESQTDREVSGASSEAEAERRSALEQWKGLATLATEAVTSGASAIERVHLAVARRPFDVLEEIPVVAGPAAVVRVVHDLSTRASYASVRGVARLVGRAVGVVLDHV